MSEEKSATAEQRALANRTGVSRKLLARKARAKTATQLSGVPVESDFPTAGDATRQKSVMPSTERRTIGQASAQQRLQPGDLKPNPNTVVGTIVRIVADRGQVSRADLIDEMRESRFPHPSARPHDTRWCQGYVAGAIRQGFLAAVTDAATDAASERPASFVEER